MPRPASISWSFLSVKITRRHQFWCSCCPIPGIFSLHLPLSLRSSGLKSTRRTDALPTFRQHPEPDNLYHGEAVNAFDNLATFFDANCALQVFFPSSS